MRTTLEYLRDNNAKRADSAKKIETERCARAFNRLSEYWDFWEANPDTDALWMLSACLDNAMQIARCMLIITEVELPEMMERRKMVLLAIEQVLEKVSDNRFADCYRLAELLREDFAVSITDDYSKSIERDVSIVDCYRVAIDELHKAQRESGRTSVRPEHNMDKLKAIFDELSSEDLAE